MNWRYNNPIVNGDYICCVEGLEHPIAMYWHNGDWGYINDDDFMPSGHNEMLYAILVLMTFLCQRIGNELYLY